MAVAALANYLPRFGAGVTGDIEAGPAIDRVAEAELRGRRLATAEAEARTATLLAEERSAAEARLAEARRAWVEGESERLQTCLAEAFSRIEAGIAEATTRVLAPFLESAARDAAVDDLVRTLETLLADGEHRAIRISGPEDLLAALQARIPTGTCGVTFAPGEAADVTVIADKTIMMTQIGAWMDRLRGAEPAADG